VKEHNEFPHIIRDNKKYLSKWMETSIYNYSTETNEMKIKEINDMFGELMSTRYKTLINYEIPNTIKWCFELNGVIEFIKKHNYLPSSQWLKQQILSFNDSAHIMNYLPVNTVFWNFILDNASLLSSHIHVDIPNENNGKFHI
jgi:hypothetical protein